MTPFALGCAVVPVRLTSGGTEVVCMVNSYDGGSDALLLDRLPRTPRVEGVTAHYLLRTFTRGLHRMIAEHSGLTPGQIRSLQSGDLISTGPVALDDQDRLLLRALAQDGRAGLAHLAAVTRRSRSSVRRRMTELIHTGALYFDIEIDQRARRPQNR